MKTHQISFFILLIKVVVSFATLPAELNEENLEPKSKDLTVVTLKKPKVCTQNAQEGDFMKVHYTGRFKDEDGKIFDSSKNRGHTFNFVLGKGQAIQAYEIGLPGMCVGETRVLYVPSDLAYGEIGYPPTIPPNSDLYFLVDLVHIDRS
ncbi:uncharacterized protein [Lepeophtheirus salmonis]|uniref:uncharacterized protein n=1 Tax=Lepeophtheirus salmonis TaxID=72036 RepID=UPI001AE20F31|nr:FK506-binding protein 2-like [Lepeophtheirus salmonis]